MPSIRVYNPDVIRNVIQQYKCRPAPVEFSPKKFDVIIGMLEGIIKQRPEVTKKEFDTASIRRVMFGWLCLPVNEILRPVSSKELTPQEQQGLYNWCKPESYHNQDNPGQTKWAGRPAWKDEVNWIITRSLFDYSRTLESIEAGKPVTIADLEKLATQVKTTPISIDVETGDLQQVGLQLGGVVTPTNDPEYITPIQNVLAAVTYQRPRPVLSTKYFEF